MFWKAMILWQRWSRIPLWSQRSENFLYRKSSWRWFSGAAAQIHDHRGNLAINYLLSVVEVEHVDGGHFGGRAAGPCCATWICFVHQVCVWELLQVDLLTLAWAVVSLVALGCDDPVPAEVLEVYGERVTAAAWLWRSLATVQARFSSGTFRHFADFDL